MPSAARKTVPTVAPDQYLQVGGARLRYRDSGTGPALLLLHGWTLDLEMWEPQVGALAGEFRLVRLDRRGHGLSGGSPEVSGDAQDAAALCQHLGLAHVALLGMSQGARGALALAVQDHSLVRALILDGPPALEAGGAEEDVPLEEYRRLIRTQGAEAFRRRWQDHPLMQLHSGTAGTRVLLAQMIGRYAGTDLLAASSARPAQPLDPGLVRAPTLIVSGALDLAGRLQSAARLCAQLPHAERALIAGAGHLPNLERAEEYSDLCRSFLRRHLPTHTAS